MGMVTTRYQEKSLHIYAYIVEDVILNIELNDYCKRIRNV